MAVVPAKAKQSSSSTGWATNFLMGGVAASISKTVAAPIVRVEQGAVSSKLTYIAGTSQVVGSNQTERVQGYRLDLWYVPSAVLQYTLTKTPLQVKFMYVQ